jgi:hypothetical protein
MTTPVTVEQPAIPTLVDTLAPFRNDVLFVKNTEPGPAVFTTDATRSDGHVVWQGAGDPNGQDIQVVPKSLLSNVQFQRGLQLGIFELVQDPALGEAALAAQQAAWINEQGRRQNVNPDAIFSDPASDQVGDVVVDKPAGANDLQVSKCVFGACPTEVALKGAEIGAKPPLCKDHARFAGQFIAQEDHNAPLVQGKAPVIWVHPTMGRA